MTVFSSFYTSFLCCLLHPSENKQSPQKPTRVYLNCLFSQYQFRGLVVFFPLTSLCCGQHASVLVSTDLQPIIHFPEIQIEVQTESQVTKKITGAGERCWDGKWWGYVGQNSHISSARHYGKTPFLENIETFLKRSAGAQPAQCRAV